MDRSPPSRVPSFSRADLRSWWERYLTLALPQGIFLALDADGRPVATSGCIHSPRVEQPPFTGQLAWVATDPAHQRKGLAMALSATATRRLLEIGYDNIVVVTGDDLVPAIKVYLGLGYKPLLYEDGMAERWRAIRAQIQSAESEEVGLPGGS